MGLWISVYINGYINVHYKILSILLHVQTELALISILNKVPLKTMVLKFPLFH